MFIASIFPRLTFDFFGVFFCHTEAFNVYVEKLCQILLFCFFGSLPPKQSPPQQFADRVCIMQPLQLQVPRTSFGASLRFRVSSHSLLCVVSCSALFPKSLWVLCGGGVVSFPCVFVLFFIYRQYVLVKEENNMEILLLGYFQFIKGLEKESAQCQEAKYK